MEIVWLGHSCFRLRGSAATVLTDPFSPSVGFALGSVSASMVLVSHQHPHHNNWRAVGGEPVVIEGPGEYELSGVFVRGLASRRVETEAEAPRNVIYVVEVDGLTLCHLGDLGGIPSARLVEEIGAVDILFVPVGGGCTLEPPQAVEAVGLLGPRLVVPMHYRLPETTPELATLDPFLRQMGLRDVEPQARLAVTRSSLPAETRVAVLERAV